MKVYAIAEMNITDPSWIDSYVANVTAMVERFGGRYLARTNRVERLEGERPAPQVVVLVEWPSREAADAFYESDDYRPYREARGRGAENHFWIVTGHDVAKRANITP
jgi:uncharacterized protein (DUF1330 family)